MRKLGGHNLMVFLLLSSLIFPCTLVEADGGGGALISTNSIGIIGDGGVGRGDISVNFSLVEMLSDEINCTYAVTLSDLDGNILSNFSEVVNLLSNEQKNVTHTFTEVFPGIYFLKISILHGAAPPNSQSAEFTEYSNFTVQRLFSQSISVSPIAQWDLDILDGQLVQSTNETLRDGESLDIKLLISNQGDVNWTGNWRYLHLNPDSSVVEQVNSLSVNRTSTTEVSFSLISLAEGTHVLNFSVIGANDAISSDDYRIYQFDVDPPPLANISVNLSSNGALSAIIGSNVVWNISVHNSGLISYYGLLRCNDRSLSNIVFEELVTIGIDEFIFREMTLSAAPGIISCQIIGDQRLDFGSANYTQHEFEFDAAQFVQAGQSGLSIRGGPWFAGDTIHFSLILLNKGNYSGTTSLSLSYGELSTSGLTVTIESGSSAELTSSIAIPVSGKNIIKWSVQSQDGYVSENLSGEVEIFLSTSQWLNVSLDPIDLKSSGMDIDWSLDLSEGSSRVVDVLIGYDDTSGVEHNLLEFTVQIEPGRRNLESSFDLIDDAESLWIKIQVSGWISLGLKEVSEVIPQLVSSPELTLSAKTTPSRPVSGESAELNYLISNTGQLSTKSSRLYLVDTNDMILWSTDLEELNPGSSSEGTIEISSWPDGSVVDLSLVWSVDGSELVAEESYLSESSGVSSESFSEAIPWLNLAMGLVIGITVVLISRVAHTWTNSKNESGVGLYSRRNKEDESTNVDDNVPKDEKKEVSCTSCSQKLKVPSDYSGQVKCPACKHQFDVANDVNVEIDIPAPIKVDSEKESSREITGEKQKVEVLTSSSSTDIVKCPDCASKLRVPLDKRPVRARCPACKVEFRALSD